MTTVRTADKGKAVLASLPEAQRPLVSFAIVDDVAREGAFDVVLSDQPFDYVIHTASPYQLRVDDPVRDLLDPALRGTTGLLRSVQKLAPSVKRVVLTSSSAAMLNPAQHAAVYDESCWRPMTWTDAQQPHNAYEASKVFAERAAWAFVNGSDDVESAGETAATGSPLQTSFDLAVINCTYTFGPVQRWLDSWEGVNASNQRIRDLVLGRWAGKTADDRGEVRLPGPFSRGWTSATWPWRTSVPWTSPKLVGTASMSSAGTFPMDGWPTLSGRGGRRQVVRRNACRRTDCPPPRTHPTTCRRMSTSLTTAGHERCSVWGCTVACQRVCRTRRTRCWRWRRGEVVHMRRRTKTLVTENDCPAMCRHDLESDVPTWKREANESVDLWL